MNTNFQVSCSKVTSIDTVCGTGDLNKIKMLIGLHINKEDFKIILYQFEIEDLEKELLRRKLEK